MVRTVSVVVVAGLTMLVGCSLKKRAPDTCLNDDECPAGQRCSLTSPNQYLCVTTDGGVPGCSDTHPCADAGACDPVTSTCVECVDDDQCHGKGVCDTTQKVCVECLTKDNCSGGKAQCDMTAQICVQCLQDAHCGGVTPICDGRVCRGCKRDGECAETGVCMADGHCAPATEVAYVEFRNDATCPNPAADGTAAKPFCTLAEAVAVLSSNRPVLVIRGPAGDRLSINRPALSAVVVGKSNAAGAGASITAGPSTGVQVAGGDVVLRDVTVSGGAAGGRGILVSGASAKLRLAGVTVSLGTGLGVQADTDAELHMDRCRVEGNSVGGILVNGATYDIQNTIVASNAYGVKFSAAMIPGASQFRFNTVAGNAGNATTCDATNVREIAASIVLGVNDTCAPDTKTITSASLSATFHLTARIGCPNGDPANPPDHDFDGDPRPSPIDCGADQYK